MDGIGCGTAIFRNYDRRFSGALERSRSRRTLPVEAAVEATRDRISVTFSDGSSQATASRDGRFDEARSGAGRADGPGADSQDRRQSYEVCRIEVRWDMPRFVPVSLLNELRREALSRLDAGRAACYVRRSRREENLRALFPDTELSAEETSSIRWPPASTASTACVGSSRGSTRARFQGCRVMRTRYCLRRRRGSASGRTRPIGDAFLASGRHVYELLFDCARCEMSVVYRGERGEPVRKKVPKGAEVRRSRR
ncbi:MAG: DUF3656 domain-containing protein [Alistipes sp.]